MSDEDRYLERLGASYELPTDPLGGVADRLRRRARRRGAIVGGLSVLVAVALVAGISVAVRPTSGPGLLPSSRTVEANGLSIDTPSGYSVLTSARAYAGYRTENGPWSPLGLARCGWILPGANGVVPAADDWRQFALAAFLDEDPATSEPTHRLLALRNDQLGLDALTRCEIDVRAKQGGRLLQQTSVVVGGSQAIRLVFGPLSVGDGYLPGPNDREVLFLVDVVTARWALDFTAVGQGTDPATAIADFDAMAATARFSP